MDSVTETILDEEVPQARLGLLPKHFSQLDDARERWRVVYPLGEVLLLVTCATIASCDDYDDIIAWGKHRLGFLRRFSEFHHGIPCERWLRCLVNRVDPALFGRCFENWVAALWPDRHAFIAIDGKTSRRTHDRRKGSRLSIRSAPMPPTQDWSWRSSACRRRPTKSPPFRIFSINSPRPGNLKARLSPSTPSAATSGLPTKSSNTRPTTCCPSREIRRLSKPMWRTISAPLPPPKP